MDLKVEVKQLEAGQIEAGQIEAGQIEAGQIEAGQIESGQIEAAQLEAAQIEADENQDYYSDLKKICELKELSQLGENKKKVVKCFNDLYCTKGDNLTNSLSEIYSIDVNSDTILYILQKYLHMHGLCIPCYKFTNNDHSCEYNIRCKWCHHHTHLNINSVLYPNKILHAKNKCNVCTHFLKGRLCLSKNECKFCHSFDHLPIYLKTKYYNILNNLYKKKMNTNIINKHILKKMKKSIIKENTYHSTFYVIDKDLMNIFGEHEKDGKNGGERDGKNGGERDGKNGGERDGKNGGERDGKNGGERDGKNGGERDGKNGGERDGKNGDDVRLTNSIPQNNIIYDQNNKKKKITIHHTCNECSQNKKPCLDYFLSLKDCQDSCNKCHDDIHKNKFSNLYFLTYMHNNKICNVCPFINEERCNCDQTTTYCHDTDHILFDIKFKNSFNVSSQYLQSQFLYKKEKQLMETANEEDEGEDGYVSNPNDASLIESANASNIDAHDDNNTLEKEEPKT
ncbi:centrosomal protein CEP120 [Plasmodium yoelii yoelii]|uniref:Centrosomal protein CEP120 n=1 Tax=Plasmodium yoelii yoelii TaxID=73239 RepID=A0AAF0B3J4_PLAYO|nr:centrosomal protein CEP120 [Plasmodium yoelii yoelii]